MTPGLLTLSNPAAGNADADQMQNYITDLIPAETAKTLGQIVSDAFKGSGSRQAVIGFLSRDESMRRVWITTQNQLNAIAVSAGQTTGDVISSVESTRRSALLETLNAAGSGVGDDDFYEPNTLDPNVTKRYSNDSVTITATLTGASSFPFLDARILQPVVRYSSLQSVIQAIEDLAEDLAMPVAFIVNQAFPEVYVANMDCTTAQMETLVGANYQIRATAAYVVGGGPTTDKHGFESGGDFA